MAKKGKLDAGTYSDEFGEDFQRHILAVCCRQPEFVLRYRSALDHTYFNSDVPRTIARALFAFVDENSTIPHSTTLLEEVRPLVKDEEVSTFRKAIKKLFAEDIQDADAVANRAVEFGKMQAMVNAVLEAAEEVDKGNRREVIPLVHEADLIGEDILDLGIEYVETFPDRAAWYMDPKAQVERMIPTGIPHLDFAMGGGLPRGELGAVLAPPGKGKTTALVNFGFGALTALPPDNFPRSGYNVVHFSCEMDEDRVARRYDDRLAGPKNIRFKKKEPSKYIKCLELEQGRRIRGRLFIKDYPTRTLTSSMIRSYLALLSSRGFKPDLLIVDYGDIMKAERRLGDMRHEQSGIYEDLRRLAGEYDTATWTASQAKASALEKETLTIAEFAEAFEKAAIVGCALAMCQTMEERLHNPQELRLVLAKYRDEEDGRTIRCRIRRDCCWIKGYELIDPSTGRIFIKTEEEEEDMAREDEDIKKPKKKQSTKGKRPVKHDQKVARLKHQVGAGKGGKKKRKQPKRKVS